MSEDDAAEFIEHQQTEIDNAAEDIKTRLDVLRGRVRDGMLDGECLNSHENQQFRSYLEGYADALAFAKGRVERIDNLVKYAIEYAEGTADARPAAEQATVYRCHACELPTPETLLNDECPRCGTEVDWNETPNGGDA
jgi:rubrerythrin